MMLYMATICFSILTHLQEHDCLPTPLGFWPLSQISGDRDITRGARSLQLGNVNWVTGPYGRPGGAVKLLGQLGSHLTINNHDHHFQLNRSFTFTVWIRVDQKVGPIFEYRTEGGHRSHLWVWPTLQQVHFNSPHQVRSTIFVPGTWQHLVASYDRDTNIFYYWVDGAQRASQNIGAINYAAYTQSETIRVGHLDNDNRYLDASLSCMRIYGEPLITAEEVRQAMEQCQFYAVPKTDNIQIKSDRPVECEVSDQLIDRSLSSCANITFNAISIFNMPSPYTNHTVISVYLKHASCSEMTVFYTTDLNSETQNKVTYEYSTTESYQTTEEGVIECRSLIDHRSVGSLINIEIFRTLHINEGPVEICEIYVV